MSKTVYKYTDDSYSDRSIEFYNAVGWNQNGEATSLWELYVDAIVAHKSSIWHTHEELSGTAYTLYKGFTLEELATLCDRLDIVLERVDE